VTANEQVGVRVSAAAPAASASHYCHRRQLYGDMVVQRVAACNPQGEYASFNCTWVNSVLWWVAQTKVNGTTIRHKCESAIEAKQRRISL
jgi:hypothetical protein